MIDTLPFTSAAFSGSRIFFADTCSLQGSVPSLLAERLRDSLAPHISGSGTIRTVLFQKSETCSDPEEYRITLTPDAVTVQASAEAGFFYGAQTLLRLLEEKELLAGNLHDKPCIRHRWFKCYLPAPTPEGMQIFKDLASTLARYKYNGIMIEIGGAMEYKTHPEINQGWIEYSAFMNEYSGKPTKIQRSMSWDKNSVHTTNGGGLVLTQEQVRELIEFCRLNHLQVIPEMPSLSHCDYLLTRHPELAERPNDPYPDTVCPNHPGYYPLLFDLFQEVIDVFQPEILHIGHDECYSIGLCPRCKDQKACEIYAADIRRCHDFLKSKGVKTMIWGEKLLNGRFHNGGSCGGAETAPRNGREGHPSLWQSVDLVPRDLLIMHWYWSVDRHAEQVYIDHDLSFMFGNFSWKECPEWQKRIKQKCFSGAGVSSWGNTDFRSLQRNGLLFDMVSLSAAAWNPAIAGESDYPEVRDWTFRELCRLEEKLNPGPSLCIRHTCDLKQEYVFFYDGTFVDEKKDLIGWHILKDEAGKTYELPVIYGSNISCSDVSLERIAPQPDDGCALDIMHGDYRLTEVSFQTRPVAGDDGRTFYICRYVNPAPGKKLTYAGFRAAAGRESVHVEAELL